MPSQITTPSPDNPILTREDGTQVPLRPLLTHDFLGDFMKAHDLMGYNWQSLFDYFFTYGYSFKTPDYWLLGCVDKEDPECWFVWWADCPGEQNGVALFLSLMPYYLPKIKFARALKGRTKEKIYSTDRLLRLTGKRA